MTTIKLAVCYFVYPQKRGCLRRCKQPATGRSVLIRGENGGRRSISFSNNPHLLAIRQRIGGENTAAGLQRLLVEAFVVVGEVAPVAS